MERPGVRGFFDPASNTVTYLVWDPSSREAAVIDPVLDFDACEGTAETRSAEAVLRAAQVLGLSIRYALETHVHADHLSGAPFFREACGARIVIGARVCEVQKHFASLFGADDVKGDGCEFDLLVRQGDRLPLGRLEIAVIETPGHTAADVSYLINDAVFVGDTLFMPDYGTARTDFPGGDARTLYRSIQKLLTLPANTRLFTCHDYKAPGRDEYRWETTIADERGNVHLAAAAGENEFVRMREERDATLSTPKLLLPSIQVNIRGGRLPPPDGKGVSYLKIPVRLKQEPGSA